MFVCAAHRGRGGWCLDVVDIDLLGTGALLAAALRVTVLVELEGAVAVLTAAKGVGLVDLGVFGQLAVRLDCEGVGIANDQSPCYVP